MKTPSFKGQRWNQQRADARKSDIAAAKAAQGQGNNVQALRDRIDRIERILGIS